MCAKHNFLPVSEQLNASDFLGLKIILTLKDWKLRVNCVFFSVCKYAHQESQLAQVENFALLLYVQPWLLTVHVCDYVNEKLDYNHRINAYIID